MMLAIAMRNNGTAITTKPVTKENTSHINCLPLSSTAPFWRFGSPARLSSPALKSQQLPSQGQKVNAVSGLESATTRNCV
jgi:hypothetical protein